LLWVGYRFDTTHLFRFGNLPNPSRAWGAYAEESVARATLLKLIGSSAQLTRTYADFLEDPSRLPGYVYSPRVGSRQYRNILEATRSIDIGFSNEVAKVAIPE